MSVNEDMLQPCSDSFWEIDCYKRTVKRQDDGFKLCTDLMSLIQDRADLEKHYAKSLKSWSQKWAGLIEKGPEYGTTEAAVKSVLTEAEEVAELHLNIKDKLLQDVQSQIRNWKTESYHKGMVGPIKQTKELEDGFKKAQKPWAKKYGKVYKTKKEFHTACKLQKTSANQESNAKGDSAVSPDQLKKLQDKAEKCRRDVESTREKYEVALRELNEYNPKYMEDMTEMFQKSQEFEERRLKFFKEMMYGVHECVSQPLNERYGNIYNSLHQSIGNADYSKDLKWWSQNHGVDMAMHWPVFEEYSPDMHTISRKEKKGSGMDGGIMLTSISREPVQQQPPPAQQQQQPTYNHTPQPVEQANTHSNSNGGNQNPFDDAAFDEDQYENPALVDDGDTGVAVRALYDYEGQEEDELTFRIGDIFTKLRDKDDQGWCTGRKDGKIGLYPDNYAEPA